MAKSVKKEVKNDYLYNDSEDKNIKKVAYSRDISQKILLSILIIIFVMVLGITLSFIKKYYNISKGEEIINISTEKNNILICNNGRIEETLNKLLFENNKEEYSIKRVNNISVNNIKGQDNDGIVYYNVKYNIIENEFDINNIATNKSDVLVRFSYSYDNEKWYYVKNAISTAESTLTPLMGNFYDISGIVSDIKVATNNEIKVKADKNNIVYWRSETIFKNNLEDNSKKFTADFKIEYKESK